MGSTSKSMATFAIAPSRSFSFKTNSRSLSQAGDPHHNNGLDFDMEWACYSLAEEENKQETSVVRTAVDPQTASGEKRKIRPEAEPPTTDSKRSKGKSSWRKYGQKTL